MSDEIAQNAKRDSLYQSRALQLRDDKGESIGSRRKQSLEKMAQEMFNGNASGLSIREGESVARREAICVHDYR